MQDTTSCHCGCVPNTEDTFCFDEIYCEDCLEEVTVVCDHCGRRISVSAQ